MSDSPITPTDSLATPTGHFLTPSPTGSDAGSSSDTGEPSSSSARARRRQTAFYPNARASAGRPKPFSRSAAKRESVMMLGSIEHLQHYFTKTGLQSATV